MLNRRSFLVWLIGLIAMTGRIAIARTGCSFGAIRWDAQYSDQSGEPGFEEEQILGPKEWQFRAPLHTKILGSDQIKFEPSQKTFDAEIRAAKSGGLAYWAYLSYGTDGEIQLDHPMMKGFAFHKSSSIRQQMKFCLIVQTGNLGFSHEFDRAASKVLTFLADTDYFVCLGDRPLIYLMYNDKDLATYWKGSLDALSHSLTSIRMKAVSVGLGDPYIVVLSSPPAKAERVRKALSADAISIYAGPAPSGSNVDFYSLETTTEEYWGEELAVALSDVVPTVMVGWDTRPRQEHPPSWHTDVAAHDKLGQFVVAPTPDQFAQECRKAVRFIDKNPTHCQARLSLIYAWNENSEGGPLEPSIGDPTAEKLRAAAGVIAP